MKQTRDLCFSEPYDRHIQKTPATCQLHSYHVVPALDEVVHLGFCPAAVRIL